LADEWGVNTLPLLLSLILSAVFPGPEEAGSSEPVATPKSSGLVQAAWNSAQVVRLRHYWHSGKEHFELDRAFAAGSLFTSQSECWGERDARLVWREYGLGMGEPHTFLIDKPLGSFEVQTSRYGLGSETHQTRPGGVEEFQAFAWSGPMDSIEGPLESKRAGGVHYRKTVDWAPLKLWQAVRTNEALPSRLYSTQPNTANIEVLRLSRFPVQDLAWLSPQSSSSESVRCVRIQSETSGALTELLFSGEDLVALRFHGRGPWARRIAPERWSMIESDWRGIAQSKQRTPRARAFEAAAPFLDKSIRTQAHWWKDTELGVR